MIIPDVNLLLYAYDSDSPFHAKSKTWWQTCLSGTEPVGLPHAVLFGFLRIGTNPRAFDHPMSAFEAIALMRSWLKIPNCQLLEANLDHFEQVSKLIESLGTAGNLVSDAQLAAITMEQDAVLHTADTDFMRFQGLRWFNPLTQIGSSNLRKIRKPHSG